MRIVKDRIDEGTSGLYTLRCATAAQSGVSAPAIRSCAEGDNVVQREFSLSDIPEVNAQNPGKSPMLDNINVKNVRNVHPEVLSRSSTFRK